MTHSEINTIVQELRVVSWDRYSTGGKFTTLGLAGETRPEYTVDTVPTLWGNKFVRDSRITPSNRRGEAGIYASFETPTAFEEWVAQRRINLELLPEGQPCNIAYGDTGEEHEYSTSHDNLWMVKLPSGQFEVYLTQFTDNGRPEDGSYEKYERTNFIGIIELS
jgi:hypothetical protein